jgi:aconitate hydratase
VSHDSFQSVATLNVNGTEYRYRRLGALEEAGLGKLDRLPFSLRVLLENLLRFEDGRSVHREDIEALMAWDPKAVPEKEIAYRPARVVLQDFTGVPCVVDLAAMRQAFGEMGGDPGRINPLQPVDLVIDHSVQVDHFGTSEAFGQNVAREYERNRERYGFLRWGQQAFDNFRVVPPGTGIIHQVNVEYLGRVVFDAEVGGERWAWPDTLVGTDSHTTMINGLGILGWGVGGIEAEAAMLGQPISMLIPQVVGMRLTGRLPEGATATDLVLRVTEILRNHGVVGKFVEFFGPGLGVLSLADRTTLSNMGPEYGATMGFFPVDEETLSYLRFTGRDEQQVALVEAYLKAQGMFHTAETPDPEFSDVLDLDLGEVKPAIAGPKRPQDRIDLAEAHQSFAGTLRALEVADPGASVPVEENGASFELRNGSVVISAITSCTNTSNPAVLVAAGLVARKARDRGLRRKPWVKTSLAPGSRVVMDYLEKMKLVRPLEELGFHLVGYGCTTCIGNSGPLSPAIVEAVQREALVVCGVLSGNRNFEGRVSPHTKANYLASPPLCVAYALTGRMDVDLMNDPIGQDRDGQHVYLREIWPTEQEIRETIRDGLGSEMYRSRYASVFEGDEVWRGLPVPAGDRYEWEESSTYVRRPPFFDGLSAEEPELADVRGARVLALLGDTVTTDHISPAGVITPESPAGRYLIERGVEPKDFNSYGSRRGNHEVMMRGTFANIRLRNLLLPGSEGGVTRHLPEGEEMSIYDAAMRYQAEGTPLVVLAGKEYGTGSSRDWAAKGTSLLGIRAVIARSYERIHRSNLIGMGVLPLQFHEGENVESLGLTGEEIFDLEGIAGDFGPHSEVQVTATGPDGKKKFGALARIDTPDELSYYRNGGILQYVLRRLRRES